MLRFLSVNRTVVGGAYCGALAYGAQFPLAAIAVRDGSALAYGLLALILVCAHLAFVMAAKAFLDAFESARIDKRLNEAR